MTVAFDDSGRRADAPSKIVSIDGILFRSRRVTLLAGLGGLGLIAFTYGAFSFFGDLADPRARLPRARAAAVAMPDLKDGVPVPVRNAPPAAAEPARVPIVPAAATNEPFVPGFGASEPAPARAAQTVEPRASDATGSVARTAAAKPAPVKPVAVEPGAAEPVPVRSAAAKPLPQIENAAAPAEPQQAAVVAPLRLSKPLPPGRVETVRAKPVEEKSAAPAPVVRAASAKPPESLQTEAAKRVATAKPAREKPVKAAASDGAPAPRTTVGRREADEDSDDLGSKVTNGVTKGIKAIGGIFSDD